MSGKTLLSLAVFILAVITATLSAQTKMVRQVDGDGAFHLKETQTFLTSKNDTVTVMVVLPVSTRAEGYADIDLKENDEILMLNAKRVKSVQEFEKLYESLDVGAQIKLGIRRDGQLMMTEFAKIDPEKLPQNPNMTIRMSTDGDAQSGTPVTHDGEGQGAVRTIAIDGSQGRPMFGTGLLFDEKEGNVVVSMILDGMTGALGDADVKTGDVVTAINGTRLKNLDQLFDIYEKLEIDTKVNLDYRRGDKEMHMTFVKPNVQGRVMIREEQ